MFRSNPVCYALKDAEGRVIDRVVYESELSIAEKEAKKHTRVVRVLSTKQGRRQGTRMHYVLLDDGTREWLSDTQYKHSKRDIY